MWDLNYSNLRERVYLSHGFDLNYVGFKYMADEWLCNHPTRLIWTMWDLNASLKISNTSSICQFDLNYVGFKSDSSAPSTPMTISFDLNYVGFKFVGVYPMFLTSDQFDLNYVGFKFYIFTKNENFSSCLIWTMWDLNTCGLTSIIHVSPVWSELCGI